jgi:hypothetical protein
LFGALDVKIFLAALVLTVSAFAQNASDRVKLTFDTSEADAVLAIAAKQNAGKSVTESDWQKLFATPPYIRLKQREAAMKREFTNADFKQFVLSPETLKRAPELQSTLDAWKRADLNAAAQQILAFLPADATVHAKVYPVIKPKTNSFVYELLTDPTIFFYLDPAESMQKFQNTAAHELHHIGMASVGKRYDLLVKELPANVRPAADWMGSFGEGMAMLAAAGSADVHPHAVSPAADRERWDRDIANFNQDLGTVNQFFLDIIHGKFASEDAIRERAFEFFGTQGPWYTVGYKMAATVEKQRGRAALLACTEDPRRLLATWNELAEQHNRTASKQDQWATWSNELLTAVLASPAGSSKH